MLAFHKENTILTKEEIPRNITNKYVSIFRYSQQFVSNVYMNDISDMICHLYYLQSEKSQ